MQFITNGILASASFVLAGIACAIIIRGMGFFNLALGAIFTLGVTSFLVSMLSCYFLYGSLFPSQ